MGCEVDPLAGAAEHGHDAEACGECDPGSALGGMHAMSAPGGEAGQHTDQAEYACRGTDRAMGGAVVDGVGEVAEGATDEERKDRTAEAESAGELGFKEGDLITLKSKVDENWYDGMIHGKSGYFPVNYVTIVTPLPK